MQDPHAFLVNLALVLCVAAVTTVVFQRLHQPVVLGYLLAGAIVGPHTPVPLFADASIIHTLSELGVILLMFSLGLEFSLRKLVRVGPTAGVVAVLQSSLMLWLGYLAARAFGWTTLEGLYAGAIVAISSTTIIVKAFAEQRLRGRLTELVFGVLIVEDLIAVFLLAVLTAVTAGAGLTAGQLLATTGRLAGFLLLVLGGGLLVVPRLMRAVLRLDRAETTLVTAVGLCFAFALLAQAAGYSVALGAFAAGALVAESGGGRSVEHLVQPVRDMFAAIFFVAVGMLIDPRLVVAHWPAVLVFTLVVVVGKSFGTALGVFLTGHGVRLSVQAGMSLAQIGEFSFIIAGVGVASGATRDFLYPVAVAVSALTTLLTPWSIRASGQAAALVDRRLPAPLQTFAALYGTWLEQLRGRPREATRGRRIRRLVRLLCTDALLLGAWLIASAVWGGRAVAALRSVLPLPDALAWAAVLGLGCLVALPLLVGIARCASALALQLGSAALPRLEGRADTAAAPRRALVVTLQLAILLLVVTPLVAVTQPFLPALPGAAALIVLAGVLGLSLWRSVANLQEHARAGAQALVEVLAQQARSDDAAPVHRIEDVYRALPGLGTPVQVRIEAGSRAVGRTLGELDLRGLTGATVLAIVHGRDGVLIPTGQEHLQAGDLLAVTGTQDAVAAAQRLLADEESGSEGGGESPRAR